MPGSGKDTYIKKHLDLPVLSLDDLRRKYKAKHSDKKLQGRIIQEAQEQARIYLRKGTSFVFNATNLRKELRQKWMSIFMTYRARIKIVYIEVCIATRKQACNVTNSKINSDCNRVGGKEFN